MASIGDRIREIRKDLGLPQQKFGERLKVTQEHISKIELSKENPSNILIKLICMEFGVNDEWLREGTGEKLYRSNIDKNAYENLIFTKKGDKTITIIQKLSLEIALEQLLIETVRNGIKYAEW